MKDRKDIQGQTYERTGAELIQLVESSISEGFLSASVAGARPDRNVFGRPVALEAGTDLSFLAGLVATGLRAGAFLSGAELTANHNQLAGLVREQLPAVIHYSSGPDEPLLNEPSASFRHLYGLADTGCFQLVASDAQAAIDLAFIAHHVAERSLLPGICAMDDHTAWNRHRVVLPHPDQQRRFLGEPDLHIHPPTPAQDIVFGAERRQVPQWFDPNAPGMTAAAKEQAAMVLEAAAKERFFLDQLPAIIGESMRAYQLVTGRAYTPVERYGADPADYVIVTLGSDQQLRATIDDLQNRERLRIAGVHITVLHPFPERSLLEALGRAKVVAVLEAASGRYHGKAPLFREVEGAVRSLGKRAPRLISARTTGSVSKAALEGLIRSMQDKRDGRTRLWLDVEFAGTIAHSPQQELLMQSVRRAFPAIEAETITPDRLANGEQPGRHRPLPFPVRQYQDRGAPFTRLSRFYHHTPDFHQGGTAKGAAAEPFQALPLAPAAAAGLVDVSAGRTQVPVFHAENCTACGRCFTYCPHAALPPIVLGLEALLRGGMDMAARAGTAVAGLTPLIGKLAKIGGEALREKGATISRVGDFLPAAFDRLMAQLQLTGEKLAKAEEQITILRRHVDDFPIAVTEPFYRQPEMTEAGTGALFSIAIDPGACTGCGLCAAACEDEALSMAEATPELLAGMMQGMETWAQLPDTDSAVIQRMIRQDTYDPFAATLLSRNFYFSTMGGSASPDAAPARTTLHLLTALTESVMQPRLAAQLQRLERQIGQLSDNIHQQLSSAIPQGDFQLQLEQGEPGKVSLEAIMHQLQSDEQTRLIDGAVLKRKVDLLNNLKELRQNLREGLTGNGRSRYGLVLSASDWRKQIGHYPENIYTAPVVWHWDGSAPQRLRGLVQGLRRHQLDQLRLLRRADLEIGDKYRPELHDHEIGMLSWAGLTKEEVQIQIPLILVGDRRLLSTANSNGLFELLSMDLPVKVLILDEAGTYDRASLAHANSVLFAALNLRSVQILKGSMHASRFTFDALRDSLHRDSPALIHLFTPRPELHTGSSDKWWELPELALRTRAFPLLRYDPDLTAANLASGLQIAANPDWEKAWSTGTLSSGADPAETDPAYTFTYADWLYTCEDWREAFRPLAADEVPVPVADYLELEPDDRKRKVPVIVAIENGVPRQFVAAEAVIAATQEVRYHWDALREIAGALTAFPDKLSKQMEKVFAGDYERSLEALRSDYEAKLKTQKAELMEEVRRKLSNKLMALSKKGALH